MYKIFLLGILGCLGWASLAHAQGALGTPVTSGSNVDIGYGPYAPALYQRAECRSDCQPRPNHPVLQQIGRTLMAPIRAATGHLAPPRTEPMPTKEDVSRMLLDGGYSPAEITAAKIKIDEAQARARRAAVNYLATIDCHYYPEAESGLIAALRADRSEGVRYEAALALGCCRGFTEKMLEALNMTALGLELDGNPAESSERVRSAARQSLERSVARGLALRPVAEQLAPIVDYWLPPDPLSLQPVGYYLPTYASMATPAERHLAETVSAQPKSASPTRESRFRLFNFDSWREAARPTQNGADPRLRGLAPIGSASTLSIPAARPAPAASMYPYNY